MVQVDLTAAYDTVWLRGLNLKLLRMIQDNHMVSLIKELLSNYSFKLRTSDGQVSRLRCHCNSVPQGYTLSPTLFNIYISDLPQTTSKKYGYADDLVLLAADGTWKRVEMTLNQDMQALHQYLERWRLKLSTAKTTTTAFHLNNKDIQNHLDVSVNSTALPNNDHPVNLSVTLDCTLTYRQHIESLKHQVNGKNGFLCCLASSSWGAGTATLHTGALALVYSTAEYASPVWCRSAHVPKMDSSLNDTMRIFTECMCPTETTFLPILTDITPPDICRELHISNISKEAMENPDHILHQRVSSTATVSRQHIRSCRPFTRHAAHLLSAEFDMNMVWNNRVNHSPSSIRTTCPPPSSSLPPGADLPRKQWVSLNHLTSGTARIGKTLHCWEMQD